MHRETNDNTLIIKSQTVKKEIEPFTFKDINVQVMCTKAKCYKRESLFGLLMVIYDNND